MKIEGIKTIPTPCPSNHASNLLALGDGDLLCTWFGGTMEGTSDISIYLSRYDANSGQWLEPDKMSRDPDRSEQNPALFRHPTGEIWLLYTAQLKTDQSTAIVRRRRSQDGGTSWAPIETLFDRQGTFIRQPPVVNAQGTLLLPIWHSNIKNAFGNDNSLVYASGDGGETWDLREVPQSGGCVHMNILPSCKVAFFRSRRSDFIHRSLSDDDGLNWSKPEPTTLPNNNASIQACEASNGRIYIVYNHISAAGRSSESSIPPWVQDRDAFLRQCDITDSSAIWGVPRNPLMIASSTDLGASWTHELTIEDDATLRSEHDEHGAFVGDYSYPSIIEAPEGELHISFSYLRDYIKHVKLTL
ncbi:Predicted neuraminidase (sialidase) [Cohaesibacter sp. ES.047]|uniref:sialidase family protein n=1 Tax=Cohaesibacter sp. ES.047 TaxID=1798205 RepID=UPI000BB8096B|nr:sialidase family protein [Cohaesibacter sp. ES.047]SNY92957.1 Predicted neuraminidase (sialidase) [Cohaesibacter sp. ES.047]